MYETFYGLTENPFNITPDPKFLYLSEGHEESLAHLLYSMQRKRGLVVLTGETGTGKTTLLYSLIERLDTRTHVAFLVNPQVTIMDIFQLAFHAYGLEAGGRTKGELLIELKKFLLRCASAKENVVLIFDEAQHLSPNVLEELRLLTNLETVKEKLIQIILVGQPALETTLHLPELAQLKQRVGISHRLLPLNYFETKGYIESRLATSGVKDDPFGSEAIRAIYTYSKGVPRLINTLCDLALFFGFSERKSVIGSPIVRQAAESLQLAAPDGAAGRADEGVPQPDLAGAIVVKQAIAMRDVMHRVPDHSYRSENSELANASPARRRRPVVVAVAWIVCVLVVGGLWARSSETAVAALDRFTQSIGYWFTDGQTPRRETPPLVPYQGTSLGVEITSKRTSSTVPTQDNEVGTEQGSVPDLLDQHSESTGAADRIDPKNVFQLAPVSHSARRLGEGGFDLHGTPEIDGQEQGVVIVQGGDTLIKIIRQVYGQFDHDLLALVQQANPDLTDVSRIEVGQRIILPLLPEERRATPDTLRQEKQ